MFYLVRNWQVFCIVECPKQWHWRFSPYSLLPHDWRFTATECPVLNEHIFNWVQCWGDVVWLKASPFSCLCSRNASHALHYLTWCDVPNSLVLPCWSWVFLWSVRACRRLLPIDWRLREGCWFAEAKQVGGAFRERHSFVDVEIFGFFSLFVFSFHFRKVKNINIVNWSVDTFWQQDVNWQV